jgi:hypothetical protein
VNEPFGDAFSGLYLLGGVAGAVLLLIRRARSPWAGILAGGFAIVGGAYVWWFLRWNADGCTDTAGACGGLETALAVIFAVWALLVAAAFAASIVWAVRRHRTDPPQHRQESNL